MTLDRDELAQYARHLVLPEVGVKGQERLKAAKVLLVGAGGLGSPAALYLAAAGVGRLGLVDADVVDRSNLQRQVLYGEKDVGRPKVKAAKARLEDLNPHVTIDAYETTFRAQNAHDLFRDYDILVDGTDNFPTRYLSNDVAALQGKPNVHASIYRFEGQASVFDAKRGPCYRCLYPKPPPPDLVPTCAEGGVLGVLPGLLGSIQAVETVKLILGAGETLLGKLLLVDTLTMEFTTLQVPKRSDCPLCGSAPTIRELVDYEEFCGVPSAAEGAHFPGTDEVTATQLAAALAKPRPPLVLDVREPWEAELASIPGALLMPMGTVPARVKELPTDRDIVVQCHSGIRSANVVRFLRSVGYHRARNLAGGISAWSADVDPTVPQY